MNTDRLDKTAFAIRKQSAEPPTYENWLSKKAAERVSAVEFLRKQYVGTQSRLQSVYRIVKRSSR